MTGKSLTRWTVVDEATGQTRALTLTRAKRRGRKPTVKGMHKRVSGMVERPVPRNSVRLMLTDVETSVLASRPPSIPFQERVERHWELLRKRGHPQAAEVHLPTGQAGLWYADAIQCVPKSGQMVARQLARLCGDDSRVTASIRSLADAVGHRDRAGHASAYARRGVECLVQAGWLRTDVTGAGQDIATTFYLLPGDRDLEWFSEDHEVWQEARF